jgi:formamidopyrimidine-DNA glycosylase
LDLGPDALRHGRSFEVFRDALAGRGGTIKAALMAQDTLAGIGNVYSDEILYQAYIHPKTPVAMLNARDFRKLHRCMIKVLETAIERKVDVGRMPRTWLLPHREDGRPCPRCGERLKTLIISGRTSYVCEGCQELKSTLFVSHER